MFMTGRNLHGLPVEGNAALGGYRTTPLAYGRQGQGGNGKETKVECV